MEIKFCGAARTVTGSAHLLTLNSGYKILMDCGLYQGRDEEFDEFNENWMFDPSEIDCLVLSHAHIDHCGRIPKLVKDGFRGEIFCTTATLDLCTIMLMDSARIQEKDAEYLNKKNRKKGQPENAKPLYTTVDVYDCIKMFVGIGYEKWHRINEVVSVYLRDCGHIFGSTNVTLRIKEDGKEVNFGFSGDIGRPNRPILKDPRQMKDLDYLICESTYGGQTHNDLPHDEEALLNVIFDTCVRKKGKLIIPAFSVGRTQEIVYMLDQLETADMLPSIPVFVDSPLAINATEIFRLHPECFDTEIIEYMIDDPNPFGFNNLKYTRRVSESIELNTLVGPAIIISASGMMAGGRIMHHLINHVEDQRNTILIVGFCAPHTTGARIRNGDKKIRVFGVKLDVNANVIIMDSYSAHGDHQEMLDFLSNLDKDKLKKIFLVHGEIDRQEKFKEGLEENGFQGVEIPEIGQKYKL
ncbi:MAG: MBL fold metallo-hydrolase RNA specificity domain-containing protein [Thermodesulfobacteriota bacterium]